MIKSNVHYYYFRNGTCKIIGISLILYLYILSEGGAFPEGRSRRGISSGQLCRRSSLTNHILRINLTRMRIKHVSLKAILLGGSKFLTVWAAEDADPTIPYSNLNTSIFYSPTG